MQFAEFKEFRHSLNQLWKRGGRYQKAADGIHALLGRIGSVENPLHGLRTTKHGESRIPHCVKYDLNDFSRLVTVQTNGFCILLYCGDHEDADRWVERRRGLVPVMGPNNRVIVTYCSSDQVDEQRVAGASSHYAGPLYERLPESLFDDLIDGLPRRTVRVLEEMGIGVSDDELWTAVAAISDVEQRLAVHDVFALLRDDRLVEAVARLKLYVGEVVSLDTVEPEALPDIVDSDVIRRIDPTSPQYAEALRRFMKTAKYRDWMTFMHPDQERIAIEDFDGPAKLVGVSGSGKTCVVVQRAVRLAAKYAGERVLVLTLNRALAALIDELVTACADSETRSRIDVKPLFVLCRDLVLEFEPHEYRRYDEVTWKANEHVDEIWQEYYRCETNNFDARVFQEVHDSLLARGWNAERYLREEVDWLRSALKPPDRYRYRDIERTGRTVPLPPQYRDRVLEGAAKWEDKMQVIGVVDSLGIAQALTRHLSKIRPLYRCVLVDEVQDFGSVELEIVRALARPGENDLFLCGDAAQAVTSKHQRLRDAGIVVTENRARRLAQNYRNSRDVLLAAYEVLFENLTNEILDREDFEVLDPVYSAFTASTPLLLEGDGLEAELRGAFAVARERLADLPDGKACIAVCGFSLYELAKYGEELGVPVLDGSQSLDAGNLFLSDLEQTKGFEFDVVCIVNCSERVLPDGAAPEEERFRDLARLYVAMTRAKADLIVSWSRVPSPFLANVKETFLRDRWASYLTLSDAPSMGVPRQLEAYRDGTHRKSWRDMTGEEFLFSDMALGVGTELSAKLREVIDGRGLRRAANAGGYRVKWRNLGDAIDDYRKNARVRNRWGTVVGPEFVRLVERLELARLGSAGPVPHAHAVRGSEATRPGSRPSAQQNA